ncbi:hypothetical protein GCM10023165_51930 [Variovorax defluvii]|uniref:Dyp-type peroxidase C-terminal domain-containing protein n=1 Tax=Variovorax defluvii TaxID=913761 RepID=A0ABP8IFP5_9BURK
MRTRIRGGELGGITNLAVLAPVKPGFVPGFETITYVDRLHRLLDALNEARQNLREATLYPPPFPDAIGRFGIIRSFRYVVVPPEKHAGATAGPGGYRLSLNVTFDGGWEPYMRVIYRDLGPLLDTLFCHCDHYPGSRSADFDTYCRWVRANEQSAGLLYADTTLTLSDQQYHERIERIQRETANPAEADRRIAAFAVAPLEAQVRDALAAAARDPGPAVSTSMRALKGLYRLSSLFPGDEQRILRCFTGELLHDFATLLKLGLEQSPRWKDIADAAKDELAWFKEALATTAASQPVPPKKALDPTGLQAGIVVGDDTITHGCLVLMQVVSPKAAGWLQAWPVSAHGEVPTGIRRHLAFSHAGLRALGIPAERLDALPQAFMDGMEARAGLLGDVRSNHPDYWPRPERCNEKLEVDPADRVDLNTVHVVMMLRLSDTDPAQAGAGLHPLLAAEVKQLDPTTCGLQVVAVQPMRSYREGRMSREHFGFQDGFSQPGIAGISPDLLQRDEVQPGDLCLGYPSTQGDGAWEESDNPLLFKGSFLVVRKLRQHVDRLQAALDRHFSQAGLAGETAAAKKAELLARMMGRHQDGTPLASSGGGPTRNDFDYAGDGEGLQCPFQSHARRVNPRDGRPGMPRILRRGMSYGPRGSDGASERGIVFMAYCANIAEQFETIQRWIAGGNSSGVSSSQADPFLAVPQPGEKRTFRYIDAHNRVARVDLGDAPFVTLEWGMYLFVPTVQALGRLKDFCQPITAPAITPEAPAPLPTDREGWRRLLEDTDRERSPARALWAYVRSQPGGRLPAPGYGVLIGKQEGAPGTPGVLDVLQNKKALYSVHGYGLRMQKSIGHNHLGMDKNSGHAAQSPVVNAAIDAIGEREAFEATLPLVMGALGKVLPLQQRHPDGAIRVSVDLIAMAEHVLAGLCTKWVGLPEPDDVLTKSGGSAFMVAGGRVEGSPQPPRCPGNLLSASPFVFTPHPRPQVADAGRTQGPPALRAVQDWLHSGRALGPLATKIKKGLTQAKGMKGLPPARLDEIIANSIAGVLLGFPPTVYGNFMRTMDSWVDDKTLWICQRRLADVRVEGNDSYLRAREALRGPLMATMRKRPVPEMLWRCPVVNGNIVGAEEGEAGDDERLILGIASALTDPKTPDEMMFGGSRDPASPVKTEHACPGYGMGVGVMLGLIAGLLEAGTLRPTGSPVLLMLTPRADWLARASAPPRPGATP